MSVNKVILLGNVCQTPKVTTFQGGGKVAQFTLATNKRAYKTKDGREIPEKSEFHNIVVSYSGLADVCEKYVNKGSKLHIVGELRNRKYTDSNGVERIITEVYVEELELLTSKQNTGTTPPPPIEDDPFA